LSIEAGPENEPTRGADKQSVERHDERTARLADFQSDELANGRTADRSDTSEFNRSGWNDDFDRAQTEMLNARYSPLAGVRAAESRGTEAAGVIVSGAAASDVFDSGTASTGATSYMSFDESAVEHAVTPSGGIGATSLIAGSPTVYKMRCPRCQKLYSVQARLVQAAGQPLQFQCLACEARFAIPLLEQSALLSENLATYEIERLPSSFVDSERSVVEKVPLGQAELRCPKCRALNALSAVECRTCGVIFAKYKPVQSALKRHESGIADISLAGRRDLTELWAQVMENYESEDMHAKFINLCYETSGLSFAAAKYARILSAAPTEEIALAMRNRVVGLAAFRTEVASDRAIWNVRIPGMNGLVIALGAACMTVGLVLPHQKDLAGVGFAAVLLGLVIRYFLRRTF
jgi:phage FluMu protein Com